MKNKIFLLMRKTFLFGAILLFCSISSLGQYWEWAKSAGAADAEEGTSIATDAFGYSYVTGYFNSPAITFGSTTLTNAQPGSSDIFIVKYYPGGGVYSAKRAGGTGSDVSKSITVDANGNSYVTGYFRGSITFDITTLTGSVSYDNLFIVKYNSAGNVVWAKSVVASNTNRGNSIKVDASENAFVTGYFIGTITFGSITLTNASYAMFVVKYDLAGNVTWAKSVNGCTGNGISLDSNGNSYIIGGYGGTVAFGSTTLADAGSGDVFVAKYDSSGNVVWAKSGNGSYIDHGLGIAADANGNIYITGYTQSGSITFGTTVLAQSMYIVKFDSSGNVVWGRGPAGGGSAIYGFGIAVDENGNPFVTGLIVGFGATFGNITLTNADGIYVVKYSVSGNPIWAKTDNGGVQIVSNSIAVDGSGGVYVTGYFNDANITFSSPFGSTTLINGGSFTKDVFVVKAISCEFPAQPSAISGNTSVCQGTSQVYSVLPVSGADNYLWSLPPSWMGNSLTNSITVTTGSAGGNISVRAQNICTGTNNFPSMLAVNVLLPTASITASSPATFCAGDSVILNANTGAGLSYQWQLNGVNISGETSSSFAATATGDYTSVVTNNCGVDTSNTIIISTIPLPPAPTSISVTGGAAKVCPGDMRTYTTPLVAGVTYNWTVPTGTVINSGQGTRTIHVTYNNNYTANGVISVVKVSSGCSSLPRSLSVNRNVPSTPSAITGLTYGLCGATNKIYAVTQVAGITYQWTVPATANIANGQGTNSITVNFPSNNFTGTVSVKAVNACGAGNARNLTVRAIPSAPVSITGPNSACANQPNVAYSTAAVATATSYTWGVPSGGLITSGLGTTSIVMKYGASGGNVRVRATNGCGNSSYRNLAVTINCREGAENFQPLQDVLIYPNPSKSYFTIYVSNSNENNYSLVVSDVIGRVVYHNENISTEENFDFGAGLMGGIYFAQIKQGNVGKIMRLVKSN